MRDDVPWHLRRSHGELVLPTPLPQSLPLLDTGVTVKYEFECSHNPGPTGTIDQIQGVIVRVEGEGLRCLDLTA